MHFKPDILREYMCLAPLALAFERVIESELYHKVDLKPPILDLGCGEGLFAFLVFNERIATGIDPNPKELARAKELGAYQELIECRGDSIPRPDSFYNTVISNSVLEHIPDLLPVLREISRILAPGGTLYFTVPTHEFERYSAISRFLRSMNLDRLATRYERLYNRFWKQIHCYPPEDWKAIVESCGFEVMGVHRYDPKKICTINDLLVPFSFFSFVVKRVTNRWILLPWLRRIWVSWLAPSAKELLRGADSARDGGLVFFSARKRVTG